MCGNEQSVHERETSVRQLDITSGSQSSSATSHDASKTEETLTEQGKRRRRDQQATELC